MITVQYLVNVTAPKEQAGNAGEVKELDDYTAWLLLKDGYVKKVENNLQEKKDAANVGESDTDSVQNKTSKARKGRR